MSGRERFLIWGSGGHGQVIADLVLSLNHEIAGFVDRRADKTTSNELNAETLDEAEFLNTLGGGRKLPLGATAIALGIGDNATRGKLLQPLRSYALPPLVHPTSVVSPRASLGRGSVVMALAAVNARAKIAEGVIVNTGAIIEHDCEVGTAAHISPGAVLSGGVRLGCESWIGASAVVIPGVKIGDRCIVGAGAVVLHDADVGLTLVGVPARTVHSQ